MHPILALGWLVIATALTPAADASLFTRVNVSAGGGGTRPFDQSVSIFDNSAISVSDPVGASATGQTDYGLFRGIVQSYSILFFGGTRGSSATVTSQFLDTLTILGGAGLATFTAVMEIEGSLGIGGTNPSAASALFVVLTIGGNQRMSFQDDQTLNPPIVDGTFDPVTSTLSKDFVFTYGTPFDLQGDLSSLIGTLGGFGDYGGTFTLFLDLPTGATLISASGARYQQQNQVSEPSTLLLLLGMVVAGGSRTRTRLAPSGARFHNLPYCGHEARGSPLRKRLLLR